MSKWILVSSHRRSGTHFLIDAICANVNLADLPVHRELPKDFNIGTLFRKDDNVCRVFVELLNREGPVVIKNHLLPEEMNVVCPRDKHEELIKEVFVRSHKLYVVRNGPDTLLSLYFFLQLYPQMDFKAFLRSENELIAPTRSRSYIDTNRVKYWSYHVCSWLNEDSVQFVSFEKLKLDYEGAMREVLRNLKITFPNKLVKPLLPNSLLRQAQKALYRLGFIKSVSTAIRPRRGNIGDSRLYFDSEDKDFFEREAQSAIRLLGAQF